VLCALCLYSYLSASTGFLLAALYDCKPTVTNVSAITIIHATTNNPRFKFKWYAKLWSHIFVANQAIGLAMIDEIPTSVKYSFDNMKNIWLDFAPFTFLIPISFVLLTVINVDKPKIPRHEIIIVKNVIKTKTLFIICSKKYCNL
jgi:hypothetical protein